MRGFLAIAAGLCFAGCAASRAPAPAEKLYFALEIRQQGELVGKPKLLAETDKVVRMERRKPGATDADYQVRIFPSSRGRKGGRHFQVALDVAVKSATGHWDVDLDHGEARSLRVPSDPGAIQVCLMVMKVDSAEFRTLMNLAERDTSDSPPYSI